jgi:hypothetical protein
MKTTNLQKIKNLLNKVEKDNIQSPKLTKSEELKLQLAINKYKNENTTR